MAPYGRVHLDRHRARLALGGISSLPSLAMLVVVVAAVLWASVRGSQMLAAASPLRANEALAPRWDVHLDPPIGTVLSFDSRMSWTIGQREARSPRSGRGLVVILGDCGGCSLSTPPFNQSEVSRLDSVVCVRSWAQQGIPANGEFLA